MPRNFAITGVAGYIAPRHLRAIRDTGNMLLAAMDPNDSVGILDKFFFHCSYFREFERFDRHLEKLRRRPGQAIEYVAVCSPNYLHDAHVRFALRIGAHAVCEKPLVLNPWNIDALEELAGEQGRQIHNVLQLRLHPSAQALKRKIQGEGAASKHEVDLTYITSRGRWYLDSWKGSVERSGGIATNIGIHFFDLLLWIFGPQEFGEVHCSEPRRMAGYLELKQARVRWYLSIDHDDLPRQARERGETTYRSLQVDGEEMEFSRGFEDLHTRVYQDILSGGGFGPAEVRPCIQMAHHIRNSVATGVCGHSHPLLKAGRSG